MERDCLFIEAGMSGYGARAADCARALGYRPVLLARNPAEYAASVIDPRPYMDEVVTVDTFDAAKLLRLVIERRPGAVIAYEDFRLLHGALLGAYAGRRDPALIEGLVNVRFKDRMRARLAGTEFDHPYAVHELADGLPRASSVGYPCVVKPVDDGGSTGVRICADEAQFADAMAELARMLVAPNNRGFRSTPAILVEAFIPGQEYSAELAYDPAAARWHLIGVTRKLVTEPPFCVEVGHAFPAALAPEVRARIADALERLLTHLELRDTTAHVEFKLDGERLRIIEVNPRVGVDMIAELVESALGVDMISIIVRLQAGHSIDGMLVPTRDLVAGVRFVVPPKPGVLTELRVPPEPVPGEVRRVMAPLPRTIGTVASSYDRLGFVVVAAEDERAMQAGLDRFVAGCEFVYEGERAPL
jgi:biotin carboxylase